MRREEWGVGSEEWGVGSGEWRVGSEEWRVGSGESSAVGSHQLTETMSRHEHRNRNHLVVTTILYMVLYGIQYSCQHSTTDENMLV